MRGHCATLIAFLLALSCDGQANKHNITNAVAPLSSGGRIQAVFFRDNFNIFCPYKWKHEISMFGGKNWEFQVYTNLKKNVFVKDGHLHLQPTLTEDHFYENFLYTGQMNMTELFGTCTEPANYGCFRDSKHAILPPTMSGKVMSIPTIRYGIVEVRAKIPQGDWLWPSIWLMPKDRVYGEWPRSGEIDMMESRGNLGKIGIEDVSSTLHWGPEFLLDRYEYTQGHRKACNWADDFHTWRMEWTPEYIATFIDDKEILRVGPNFWQRGNFPGSNNTNNIWADGGPMAPFDQEFFLILNVAVGGNNGYFPDGDFYEGGTKPWTNHVPWAANDFWEAKDEWLKTWKGDKTAMLVDYVEFRHL